MEPEETSSVFCETIHFIELHDDILWEFTKLVAF